MSKHSTRQQVAYQQASKRQEHDERKAQPRWLAGPSPLLGGHSKTLPTFVRGQNTRLDRAAEFLPLDECRRLHAAGVGQFICRGKAFRRTDKSIGGMHEPSYVSSALGRPPSTKIAEPSPRGHLHRLDKHGDVHVPMGMMTRYVADQNAGRRNTAVQLAVECWEPKDRRYERLKCARSKPHGNTEPGAD